MPQSPNMSDAAHRKLLLHQHLAGRRPALWTISWHSQHDVTHIRYSAHALLHTVTAERTPVEPICLRQCRCWHCMETPA
jgi:hypothetical protein